MRRRRARRGRARRAAAPRCRGMRLHRVAHREGQEPFDDGPVPAARRDAVDAGPQEQETKQRERADRIESESDQCAGFAAGRSRRIRYRTGCAHGRRRIPADQRDRDHDGGDQIAERTGRDHQQPGKLLIVERRSAMIMACAIERARREDQQRGEQADELAGQQQGRDRVPASRIRQRQQQRPECERRQQQNAVRCELNAGPAPWRGAEAPARAMPTAPRPGSARRARASGGCASGAGQRATTSAASSGATMFIATMCRPMCRACGPRSCARMMAAPATRTAIALAEAALVLLPIDGRIVPLLAATNAGDSAPVPPGTAPNSTPPGTEGSARQIDAGAGGRQP